MAKRSDRPRLEPQPFFRGERLVTASVLLAVFLEVLPGEADFAIGHGPVTTVRDIVTAKLICVSIILAPLVLYVKENGRSAIRFVRARVFVLFVILSLRLVFDIYRIVLLFSGERL
jgi:hypothetical protein